MAPRVSRKAATRAKQNTSPLHWDYRDKLVPRVGLPDADRLARHQKRLRRYVKSSTFLLPILVVISILAVLSGVSPRTHAPTVASSASSSPGRTVATLVMQQWLAETPSPLPGAVIQSWDGARDIAPTATKASSSPYGGSNTVTWNAELDTFTLIVGGSTQNTIYSAVVEVALKPGGGGAVALGGPSLTVVPKTDTTSQWNAGAPWSGLSSNNSVSASVQSAIDGWLAAYTSGSASQLRLAVGDTRSLFNYAPLSHVASATDTVVAAVMRNAPNSMPQTSNSNPTAEIVEVTLNLLWKGEKVSSYLPSTSGPQTTMDLLIERADTAAPVVVAWGPPGTGPLLAPYQNAIRY